MKTPLSLIALSVLTMAATASGAPTKIACTENESFDSRMMREYNGEGSEGTLQNARPNSPTGNIGDYTITFDAQTKEILSIDVDRSTSDIRLSFDKNNSRLRSFIEPLPEGAFDGDCERCRTHFEVVEAENSQGDRITIRIDDHGVYPDGVASRVAFKVGSKTFDISEDITTEMSCDGTVRLERPESSLEAELLD